MKSRLGTSAACCLLFCLLVFPLLASPAAADISANSSQRQVLARGAESYGPVTPFLTRPMSDLVGVEAWQPGDPIREVPRRFYPVPGAEPVAFGEGLADPLLELGRSPSAATIVLDVNVAGTAFTGATPPDTVGDVGPSHYVQAVNATRIAIFDKNGVLLPGYPIDLSSLAPGGGCATDNAGDPIVLYDQLADRWFLQEFTGAGLLCIYVSQTSDPTGAYYFYSFDPPDFPDYPHFGVWSDAYYGSTNEAGSGGNQTTYAFHRANMLTGAPATMQRLTAVPPVSGYGFQTLTPVDHDGASTPPGGAPGIFMRHFDGEAHGSPVPATDLLQMYEMDVDWVTPANTTVTTLPAITIADFNSWMVNYTTFFSVPQPGTSTRLDPIREAILNRLSYRNFGSHEVLVGTFATNRNAATSGTAVEAGLRWFELRRVGGIGNPWTLFQEGTFGGDTNSATANFFMGGIAMDGAGNIALGYSKTDTAVPNVFPSIGVTGRLATDTAGTMSPEVPVVAGVQAQTGTGRWGDYAAMGVDPADDCTFWYTNEYMPGGSWGTRITSFVIEECLFGFALAPTPAALDVCVASDPDPVYSIAVSSVGGWSFTVDLGATGLPPGTTASFTNDGSLPDFVSAFTVNGVAGSSTGSYDIDVTGTGGDAPPTVRTTQVTLNLAMANPGAPVNTTPANGATGVSLQPTLTWAAAPEAMGYDLEVATDAGFTNIVYSAPGLPGTSHQLGTALDPSTQYFWRVTATNVCGEATSTPFSFTTVIISCATFASTNVPQTIPDNASAVSTLTILPASGGTLVDVNVKNLVGTHTFMGDIEFSLRSPALTNVVVMARACGTAENFNLNLDDQAAPGAWPCPPVGGGTYRPSNPLSGFASESSTGVWTLTITDNASIDTGQLQSWSLELCIEGASAVIFVDGFESGNTSLWSLSFP